MQKLLLAEDVFDSLLKGKSVTIRKGKRDIQLSELLFESTEEKREAIVEVIRVEYISLARISEKDLKADGFENHKEMYEVMKRFYPDIEPYDEVTIIEFII